jgi:hypothetical protein
VLVATALVVAMAAATLLVSPGARSAVASWLGLGGVQVDRRQAPEAPASPATTQAHLGTAVTLAQARELVDFEVQTLDLEADLDRIGGGVYYDPTIDGGAIHIVYHQQQGLPPTQFKGTGALLTQFRPGDNPAFTKELFDGQDAVEFIDFRGDMAMWITGPSHVLTRNAAGRPLRYTARLSANSLVWVGSNGVTYRLESGLERDAAMELADTLH